MMSGVSIEAVGSWLVAMSATVGIVTLKVGLVMLLGYIGIRFIRLGVQQLERVIILASDTKDQQSGTALKRAATLTGILKTIALTAIWAIVIIESLQLVGFDIAPILAGAGILGLAVGFGAQNLVRDLISGFFIILEDQIRLGDVAVINGTGGLVETITFRTISLRDFSGVVHIFPNGGDQQPLQHEQRVVGVRVGYGCGLPRGYRSGRRRDENGRGGTPPGSAVRSNDDRTDRGGGSGELCRLRRHPPRSHQNETVGTVEHRAGIPASSEEGLRCTRYRDSIPASNMVHGRGYRSAQGRAGGRIEWGTVLARPISRAFGDLAGGCTGPIAGE